MAKNRRNSFVVILGSLGWPAAFGAALFMGFYALIYNGPLDSPIMHRYFATHPVAFVLMGMFFVGLSALLMKLLAVLQQFGQFSDIQLDPIPEGGQPVEECGQMLDALEELPQSKRFSYMGNRLREALDHVERNESAEALDEELKYLADADAARQQESYSLVRIITWATPMLGFLGTVVGITQALGDLATQQLGGNLQDAMKGLLSGLYIAFDTTALALSLSIGLMFLHFFADLLETQLLSRVDERATEELLGRFHMVGGTTDPHLVSVQRMGEAMLQDVRSVVTDGLESSQRQWDQFFAIAVDQMSAGLATAIDGSIDHYSERMQQIEEQAELSSNVRWEQWQTALSDNARLLKSHQEEMVRQGEVMSQAVNATGDVIKLETALNDNLKQLAGAQHFEQTVMSLSAAIHLLNLRMGADGSQPVQLGESQERAA